VRITKVTETTRDVIVRRPDNRLDRRPRAVLASPLKSHRSSPSGIFAAKIEPPTCIRE